MRAGSGGAKVRDRLLTKLWRYSLSISTSFGKNKKEKERGEKRFDSPKKAPSNCSPPDFPPRIQVPASAPSSTAPPPQSSPSSGSPRTHSTDCQRPPRTHSSPD
jgi:hypothetical protein